MLSFYRDYACIAYGKWATSQVMLIYLLSYYQYFNFQCLHILKFLIYMLECTHVLNNIFMLVKRQKIYTPTDRMSPKPFVHNLLIFWTKGNHFRILWKTWWTMLELWCESVDLRIVNPATCYNNVRHRLNMLTHSFPTSKHIAYITCLRTLFFCSCRWKW